MSDATVTITGRLTADPTVRQTATDLPVANFTVAYTARRRSASGEWEDYGETIFLRVTAWRGLALNVGKTLHKGDAVTVKGRLGVQTYTNEAGTSRLDVTCDADTVAVDLRHQTAAVERNASAAAHSPEAPLALVS